MINKLLCFIKDKVVFKKYVILTLITIILVVIVKIIVNVLLLNNPYSISLNYVLSDEKIDFCVNETFNTIALDYVKDSSLEQITDIIYEPNKIKYEPTTTKQTIEFNDMFSKSQASEINYFNMYPWLHDPALLNFNIPLESLAIDQILYGKLPSSEGEILISESFALSIKDKTQTIEQLINQKVTINEKEYTISSIYSKGQDIYYYTKDYEQLKTSFIYKTNSPLCSIKLDKHLTFLDFKNYYLINIFKYIFIIITSLIVINQLTKNNRRNVVMFNLFNYNKLNYFLINIHLYITIILIVILYLF